MNTTALEKPLLGVYGVTYRWSPKSEFVLNEVSFELGRGEVLALLGPNGSGKSTLLKAAAGILQKYSGHFFYRGTSSSEFEPWERARFCAYVPPDIQAEFPMTAYEAVLLGRICQGSTLLKSVLDRDHEIIRLSMERCLCWPLRDRDLHTLSGGEKQRVTLARAVAQGVKVLLLDEALSRMDLNHQAIIGRLLRQLASEDGYGIILVAHDLNLASEWADSALLLQEGKRVGYGPIGEVISAESISKLYPGANWTVAKSPSTGKPKVYF